MSTVTAEEVVIIDPKNSIWNRVGGFLKNWGAKAAGLVKKVGNWFAKGAKWLWNTKAVSWTVSKTTAVWRYVKPAILWLGIPVAGAIFAPKAMAIMLLTIIGALAAVIFMSWRLTRKLTKFIAENSDEAVQNFVAAADPVFSERVVEIVDGQLSLTQVQKPVTLDETPETRHAYLGNFLDKAAESESTDLMSELTARLNLIEVREQVGDQKLEATASRSEIHRHGKERAARKSATFAWNHSLMWRAVEDEDMRYDKRREMHAEQAQQPVAAGK